MTGSAGLETLLRNLFSGNLAPVRQPRPGPIRRDWNVAVCFSCGKAGHSATRCPTLNESFPFMPPGWMAVKVAGGYAMISPRVVVMFGSVVMFDPRTPRGGGGGVQHRSQPPPPGKELLHGQGPHP